MWISSVISLFWPSNCQKKHATSMQIRWIFIQADGERAMFRGNLTAMCRVMSPQEKAVLQRRSKIYQLQLCLQPSIIFMVNCICLCISVFLISCHLAPIYDEGIMNIKTLNSRSKMMSAKIQNFSTVPTQEMKKFSKYSHLRHWNQWSFRCFCLISWLIVPSK